MIEMTEQQVKSIARKQMLKTGIAIGIIFLLAVWLFGVLFALIVTPVSIVALFLFAYFYLAPKNMFFTMGKDGTSIVIDKGGEIDHLLIFWGGYIFKLTRDGKQERKEDDWIIVIGEEWHLFGGLRWIGIWPLYTVREIEAEWSHYHPQKKELVHHTEKQNSIWLKKDNYGTKITEDKPAEDIDGVAVSATLLFPAQVFNPFVIASRQKYWFSLVEPIIAAVLRQFIARYRWKEDLSTMIAGKGIEDAQKNKGIKPQMAEGSDLREELWRMIKEEVTRSLNDESVAVSDNPDFGEELRLYGIAILKMGTTIIDIDPGPEYRKAGTLEYVARKEMEATVINAQAKAEAAKSEVQARATKVGGLYVGINEELKKDGTLDEEARQKIATDLTIRDQAGQNGELTILDIRGISDPIAAAAAVYGQYSKTKKSANQKSEEKITIIKEKSGKEEPKKSTSKTSSFTTRDGSRVAYDKKSGIGTITTSGGKVIKTIETEPEDDEKD